MSVDNLASNCAFDVENVNKENIENIENIEDTEIPVVVFVATMPDKFGRINPCLSVLENVKDIRLVILHPCYDFNSTVGKETSKLLGSSAPEYSNTWETIMRKDFYCVEKSDVVVIDLDSPDGQHFLAVAICYKKPIIVVSNTLISIPAYFSGSVLCVVKPDKLESVIKLFVYDENFRSLPVQKTDEQSNSEK